MLGYLLRRNPLEIYRMSVSDGTILLTVKRKLYEDIYKRITRQEILDTLSFIERKEEDDLVSFVIRLPFITFPNYSHQRINWTALDECSENMSLLFWVLSLYLYPNESNNSFFLSNEPQLAVISTSHSRDREMHACPLEIGFSENIAQMLAKKYQQQTLIERAISEGTLAYIKLTATTKRSFEKEMKYHTSHYGGMSQVMAYVRDSGVPQFSVPGNCACLGANPDSFRHDREMYSHNLDTTLQQMTLLVVVITFWNSCLKPLYQESLK